jgi:hypothetical protein
MSKQELRRMGEKNEQSTNWPAATMPPPMGVPHVFAKICEVSKIPRRICREGNPHLY